MVAVSATLSGSGTGQRVTVAVSSLTVGQQVSVWRQTSDGQSLLRGGYGVTATSDSLILVDVAAPFGESITYLVFADQDQATSGTVQLTSPGRHVVSDPVSGVAVSVDRGNDGDARTLPWRGSMISVAGRLLPVAVHDVRGAAQGLMVWRTVDEPESTGLVGLLAGGGPVVFRPGHGACRDLPGTALLQPLDVQSRLVGTASRREWSVAWSVVDDPDPDTASPLSTWADLEAVYAALTWANFEADHTGQTWLDVATTDWSIL